MEKISLLNCVFLAGCGFCIIECKYTEDWDLNKKRSVAKQISSDEYITYIALDNDRVVGFIGLLKQLKGRYMILDMMQVSSECRGLGIGRRLFEVGKDEARKNGAEALYNICLLFRGDDCVLQSDGE